MCVPGGCLCVLTFDFFATDRVNIATWNDVILIGYACLHDEDV